LNPVKATKVENPRRRQINFLIRLLISGVALYFVFSKIDLQQAIDTLKRVHLSFFLLALLAFNLSKIVAAFRFKALIKALNIKIGNEYNIRLLYIGMFYNLFLPGSISGDAYKVYLLKQQNDTKTKLLVSAALLDRVSGLVLLLIMAGIFLVFSSFTLDYPFFDIIIISGVVMTVPAFYLGIRWFFSRFLKAFWMSSHLSFWVQAGQVACAVSLLWSLSVTDHYLDYLTLFMISSVVAVLPFTIGGVGARELVFLYGVRYLNIQEETAVTFAILFFFVTALTSLVGLFFSDKNKVSEPITAGS
jgi:glycosyltransferase 2 family protein